MGSYVTMSCSCNYRPFMGIGVAALSALFFCFQNVIVKYLSHVDFFLISLWRFNIIGLLSMPVTAVRSHQYLESPFPYGKRLSLLARCVLGAGNFIVHIYALQHLPLADTMMISASSPMFTVFSARIFIKEPIVVADIVN